MVAIVKFLFVLEPYLMSNNSSYNFTWLEILVIGHHLEKSAHVCVVRIETPKKLLYNKIAGNYFGAISFLLRYPTSLAWFFRFRLASPSPLFSILGRR
jgi:hypothetical protein